MKILSRRFATLSFLFWTCLLPGFVRATDDVIILHDVVVDFAATVDIPARQSGAVATIDVRQNQWIDQGAIVARLDEDATVIRRRAAVLRYESAQLILRDDVEIEYARTALEEARAEFDDSQQASERMSGAVARNQLRRTQLGVERAELEIARAEKQRRQAEIDSQLRAADLAMIDNELQQLRCTSPIGGVVLAVHRQSGEWVHAGDPLVSVADAAVLHLRALINADQLNPARCVGMSISVHWTEAADDLIRNPSLNVNTPSRPQSLTGKIISVDPTRLPGNRYRLHAEVLNRQSDSADGGWLLVPGMEATLRIDRGKAAVAWRNQSGNVPRSHGSLR